MNDLLTRKKHSKRIAKLAYKKGIIDKDFYNSLYLESHNVQRRPKSKNKYGYRFRRYYTELCFGSFDYWGEYDEYGLIDYVYEIIYWTLSEIDIESGKILKPYKNLSTLQIIQFLKSIPDNGWKYYEKKLDEKIDSMI